MIGSIRGVLRMLRAFRALTFRDQRAVVYAWVGILLAVIGLRALSFSRVRRLLGWVAPPVDSSTMSTVNRERITWAVRTASRQVPGGDRCLPRALAGAALLRRAGHPATIRIGVRLDSSADRGEAPSERTQPAARSEDFQAHAWVESSDSVVLGELPHLETFQPLGDPEQRLTDARNC